LVLSYVLGITRMEFIMVSLAVILVISAEMLNSAVEAVVDILSPQYSEKARTAKDIAAGAVLITAFGAAVLGYIILFPYLKSFFAEGFIIARHSEGGNSPHGLHPCDDPRNHHKVPLRKRTSPSGGMPSGHSALAFSVWVSITYLTTNFIVSMLCLVLAVWIAISRITIKPTTPGR